MLASALLGFFALVGAVTFQAWPGSPGGTGPARSVALAPPSIDVGGDATLVTSQPQPVLQFADPVPAKHPAGKPAHKAADRPGSSAHQSASVTASASRAGPGHSAGSRGASAARGHPTQHVSRSVHTAAGPVTASHDGGGQPAHRRSQASGHGHGSSHSRGHSRTRGSHGPPPGRGHSPGGRPGR